MKVISKGSSLVQKVLKKFNTEGENLRLMRYVVDAPVKDGILLYNLLTLEMVLLSDDEYNRLAELDYLKQNWFLVPDNTNEQELADLVRVIANSQQKKSENITGYTIFPTTDCNARCFYCFELGRSRIPMTEDTAQKVARYICDHCGGEKVKITWFGGEPLLNQSAVDIICTELKNAGVQFKSAAVSNGYLFDENTVEKATSLWNLKSVQITLDGTEPVYNKIKAFVYKNTNPYHIVLGNIERLAKAGINVNIRLNMDMYNAENLQTLVDELANRFEGSEKIRIYAHHIFEGNTPMAQSHTYEEWEVREQAMCRLEERIAEKGMASRQGIAKKFRTNHCMADSGQAVTILPDGNIGLCEHFSENDFIGHIDSDGFNEGVIRSFKETLPQIPECAECFYYPHCIRLKKCFNGGMCFAQSRENILRRVKNQMKYEYERFLKNTASDDEDEDLC